jgi:hypothetical protein
LPDAEAQEEGPHPALDAQVSEIMECIFLQERIARAEDRLFAAIYALPEEFHRCSIPDQPQGMFGYYGQTWSCPECKQLWKRQLGGGWLT